MSRPIHFSIRFSIYQIILITSLFAYYAYREQHDDKLDHECDCVRSAFSPTAVSAAVVPPIEDDEWKCALVEEIRTQCANEPIEHERGQHRQGNDALELALVFQWCDRIGDAMNGGNHE